MWPAVIAIVGPIIAQILAVLGIGLVTYTGVTAVIDVARAHVISSFSGWSADVSAIAGLLGIDQFVSIILASISARVALSSVRSSISLVKK